MKLLLDDGLLWVSLSVEYKGQQLSLHKVLLDTNSAGCVFNADRLSEVGLYCEPGDKVILTDEKYEERGGNYLVEKTEVNYGMNGFRRIIDIGEKL